MSNEAGDPGLYFYLTGRDDMAEGRIKNAEVDIGDLVDQVVHPDDLAKVCKKAATDALSSQNASTVKREWIDEQKDAIEATGVANADTAWSFYLKGQIDELAAVLEPEVVEELCEQFREDSDDAGGDEDSEDGGDDDEDEDSAEGEEDDNKD